MFRLGSRHTPPCTTSQHDFCLLRTKLRCRHACDSKSCPRVASKIRSESAGSCSQSEYKTGNPFNYPWSRRWGMCLSVKKKGLDGRTMFQRESLASMCPSVVLAIILLLPCLYDLLSYFSVALPYSIFFYFQPSSVWGSAHLPWPSSLFLFSHAHCLTICVTAFLL